MANMYTHKRKWITRLTNEPVKWVPIFCSMMRIEYRVRWDETIPPEVPAPLDTTNWRLEMYRAMSTMGGRGHKVKLGVKNTKRPYGYKGGGKHKPLTRRTSRRLAKLYLAAHGMDADFNHRYAPGIGDWD